MVGPLRESPTGKLFAQVDFDTVREKRGWFVTLGILSMILGVLTIVLPFSASLITTIAIGWLIVLAGVTEGYHAFQNRGWAGAGWEIVSAAVQVIVGLVLVAVPMIGKVALVLLLACYFIAEGALKLIRAAQHRRVQGWGWLVFDGLLALALGLMILGGGLGTTLWVIGILVGITLLAGGMSMILIGLGAGYAHHARS